MRKIILAVLVLCGTVFSCQAARPTTESIETLMAVSGTQKILDSMYGTLEQSMRQSLERTTAGQPVSPEQRRYLDAAPAVFANSVREEMSWEKLKPIFIDLYQDNFTQEEIDGMVAFYKSPVGVAFVNKVPAVMQQAQLRMQVRLQPMLEKMKAAMDQALKDAQAIK